MRTVKAMDSAKSASVNEVETLISKPILATVTVGNVPLEMEVDAGPAVSVIRLQQFKRCLSSCYIDRRSSVYALHRPRFKTTGCSLCDSKIQRPGKYIALVRS